MINKKMREFSLLLIKTNGGVMPRNRNEWNNVKAKLSPKKKRKGPSVKNEIHLMQIEKRYDKALLDGNDKVIDHLMKMAERRLPKRWSASMFEDDTWERVWNTLGKYHKPEVEDEVIVEDQ